MKTIINTYEYLDKHEELELFYELGIEYQRKNKGYNFRCPICGDSKKNKHKKRGWVLDTPEYPFLIYKCFNGECYWGGTFKNFLYNFYPELYKKYKNKLKQKLYDKVKNENIISKKNNTTLLNQNETKENNKFKLKLFKLNSELFKPITEYKEPLEYLKKRKIPEEYFEKIFFCIDKNSIYNDMIIFPFEYKKGLYYGFQGRSYKYKSFLTYSKNDNFKVYNYFNVDLTQPVYIFESIIDSLFVKNSIAMLGVDISKEILNTIQTPIFVLDNDDAGYNKIEKYLKLGYKCVIFPDNIKCKDVNDMIVKENFTKEDIYNIIQYNIYQGNEGLIKLKLKRLRK